MDEIYRRINATHANHSETVDISIPAPKLLQPSTLINENQSKQVVQREEYEEERRDLSSRFYWNYQHEFMVLIGIWYLALKRMVLV